MRGLAGLLYPLRVLVAQSCLRESDVDVDVALALEVREIAARYGQVYNSGSLWRQFTTVLKRVWIYRNPPAGAMPVGG